MVEQLVINVGNNIRELRRQRGLSLRQLSEQIEVSPSAINKIEQNLISPTLGTVLKIVKGLGTTLQSLLNEPARQERLRIFRRTSGERLSFPT